MAEVDLTELAIILQDTLGRIDNTIIVTAPPAADLGSIGAVAIDLENNMIYGPKTTLGWGVGRPTVGGPGPAIELQKSATHVQWRVVGASTWVNLIALVDLKGADGQEIGLRTNATHIQWRLGVGTWTDLIALSALMGTDGREIELQKSATHIQWRYVGGTGWTDVVPLADITPAPVPGPAAWTQEEAVVPDGERRVKQIVDWFGGDGAKPPVGQYLSATGWVATAAEAEDVRGAGGSGSGDMQGSQNLAELTDVGAARTKLDVYSKAEGDTALGAKADLVGGKIPVAQIPAVAITDTFPVASQAAMLALTAERGDVAVRSDLSKSFILQAEPAATLANWKELLTPTVVVPVFATVPEVWAASVTDKIVAPKTLNVAMIPQALAIAAGVVSPDCHNGINFDIASINANITIANLANKTGKLGRSGSITGKNGATAGRTVSLGTDWKKIGTTAFPTAANALWKLVYNIDSNGVNYSVMVLTA